MNATSEPGPGAVIASRYVLRRTLAAGGMGVVFVADQPSLVRPVAVKLMQRHLAQVPGRARQFHAEAVAASRVVHPSSVTILDYGVSDGLPYIAMELIRGLTLRQVVQDPRGLPFARVLHVIDQVLAAVGAAHGAGVVHADLKSENVLVEHCEDGTEHVKLIDYGLATILDAPPARERLECRTPMVSGTPEYMAPELAQGGCASCATDVYALGAMLYELLTGATPFSGGTASEIMRRHVCDPVTPPSERSHHPVTASIDSVVLRALAKDPTHRYASTAKFRQALHEAIVTCGPTLVEPYPGPTKLTAAIGDAIRTGDLESIASGYMALAAALAMNRQFTAAARELEEGIDVILAGDPDRSTAAVAPLIVASAAMRLDSLDGRDKGTAADRIPTLTIGSREDRCGQPNVSCT